MADRGNKLSEILLVITILLLLGLFAAFLLWEYRAARTPPTQPLRGPQMGIQPGAKIRKSPLFHR